MILVTGNLGYIGTVLTSLLLEKGYQVKGYDIGWFEKDLLTSSIESDIKRPTVQIVRDIRQIQLSDLDGVEAVIHLAGLSNDPIGDVNPAITEEINFHATMRLAKLCIKKRIRKFIFSSSCSVYGYADSRRHVTENDEVHPMTAYAKSKVSSENELKKLETEYFHPMILRNATVYGYSPRIRLDLVVNGLSAKSFLEKHIQILSDGSPWRPLIHVEDLCRAFIYFMETQETKTEVYNVGVTDHNYTVRDIGTLISKFDQESRLDISNTAEPDQRSYRVDFSKFEKKFSFQPKWNLATAIEDLYAKFQSHGLSMSDIQTKKYVRLAQVKEKLR